MFKINNGSLSMDDHDLDHIQGNIDDGDTPKEALTRELEFCGFNIDDVYEIELQGSQMVKTQYAELYSKIIADFWNNR